MRRLAPALAVVALVLGGCGGCGSGDKASSPLDDALGYFAEDAPLVASVETDSDGEQAKTLRGLLGRFPLGDQALGQLQAQLDFLRLDFQGDVRPLLGHPLVVGLTRPATSSREATGAVLVALHVDKPGKAKQTLLRQPGLVPRGKAGGVRIFEGRDDKRFAAVDDDVVLVTGSRKTLADAISRRQGDERMTEDAFDKTFAGLPSGAAVRLEADPLALAVGSPRLRPLLAIKWVAAAKRLAATFKFTSNAVTADLKVDTDKGSISEADLPIAPGSGAVPLIGRRSEIKAGARDPLRVLRFAERVARALFPRRVHRVEALARTRGIDLQREIGDHLRRNGAIAVNPVSREFAARVGVRDPAGVDDGLAQLAPVLPQLAAAAGISGVGLGTPAQGEHFYALARPKGQTLVFGVSGPWFVASNRATRAGALASEPTVPAPVKEGGAVLTADTREIASRLLAGRLGGIAALAAPLAVRSLGDTTAWATADTSRLHVHARLEIR